MLFKFWIGHEGQAQQHGFAVAETSEQVMTMAKDRFPGWAENSFVGCQLTKAWKPAEPAPASNADLGWISPIFGGMQ